MIMLNLFDYTNYSKTEELEILSVLKTVVLHNIFWDDCDAFYFSRLTDE